MKAKKSLLISLVALVAATSISTSMAYAAEPTPETTYPTDFVEEFHFDEGLKDYAVYGESLAFAYDGQLMVLGYDGNGHRLPDKKIVESIDKIDYSSDGKLYVCLSDGCYYAYPDLKNKLSMTEITVQSACYMLSVNAEVSYHLDSANGNLRYMTNSGEFKLVEIDGKSNFSHLKKYNGKAYAVMENCLYSIEGAVATPVIASYYDFESKTSSISTGNCAQELKKSDQAIMTGKIAEGIFFTEIDLQSPIGTTFTVPDPSTSTKIAEGTLFCQILAKTGNAYIVAMNGKTYITGENSVTEIETKTTLTNSWTTPAYALEKIGVYASPFISPNTKIGELESGKENAVNVLGQYTDLTGMTFSKISYQKNGETVTGYVADDLLSPYSFPNEDLEHNTGGDKQFNYQTNVTTVVLVIVIVLLVIIAVMYIVLVSTKKGDKKKKKSKRKDEDDDDDEDDNDEDEE